MKWRVMGAGDACKACLQPESVECNELGQTRYRCLRCAARYAALEAAEAPPVVPVLVERHDYTIGVKLLKALQDGEEYCQRCATPMPKGPRLCDSCVSLARSHGQRARVADRSCKRCATPFKPSTSQPHLCDDCVPAARPAPTPTAFACPICHQHRIPRKQGSGRARSACTTCVPETPRERRARRAAAA